MGSLMEDEEYRQKLQHLKILKSIQEYLKSEGESSAAVYPIKVPEELIYQILKGEGPEEVDRLVHHIFNMGLSIWSEKVFQEHFGSTENLERFIEMVKKRF